MAKTTILQIAAVATTVDKQLRPLIQASLEAGHDVHIACGDDGNIDYLRNEGFKVHKIHFERKINLKSNLKSIKELYKLMKFYQFDIIHVHTPVAAILGRIAAKLSGAKNIIYTAHGFYFHEGMGKLEYSFYYQIEKQFARYATDYLLLQSEEDYELSIKMRFKKKKNIIHLGNGVDIKNKFNPRNIDQEKLNSIRKKNGIDKSDFVFTFIGRLVREKGIYELVEAFENISINNNNVKLLLIGGLLESERDQAIKIAMRKWKQNKNIVFAGVRTDIPELLSLSDVFILPSYREGLPRSIIEAMAMERTVIATNIRGCREEVIENKTGFLVEKQNSLELYSKMTLLKENKGLCKQLGRNAREFVEKYYDEDKVLRKQLNLFESLTQ